MEIIKDNLLRYGITYNGEKDDWVKEFYNINIKKAIENGDKLYD